MEQPKIGGVPVALRPPKSLAIVYDVLGAGDNASRKCWAALAICYAGGPLVITEKLAAHRYDVLAFGGAVFDELSSAGHDPNEVTVAGVAALRMLGSMLPGAGDVEDAAGNSDAPAGSTSP
ncbi:MAG: hypothetical protein GY900_12780 [Actinomycetia bacterium]|jgi:hypothetical protein|nr:hypothetical protein [Actinomycetales bacterium]MCP4852591.1 hypothetical protein [Actinomycetes bacterium]